MSGFSNNILAVLFPKARYLQIIPERDYMKDNMKAALMSALILPGVGQIYRGSRLKGGLMVLSVTILLMTAFIVGAMAMQDALRGTVASGAVDAAEIAGRLRAWLPAVYWLGGGLLCLWIYGVADAFLAGDKREGEAGRQLSREKTDDGGM